MEILIVFGRIWKEIFWRSRKIRCRLPVSGYPLCVGLMINVMKVQECDASKFNSCSAVW